MPSTDAAADDLGAICRSGWCSQAIQTAALVVSKRAQAVRSLQRRTVWRACSGLCKALVREDGRQDGRPSDEPEQASGSVYFAAQITSALQRPCPCSLQLQASQQTRAEATTIAASAARGDGGV